VSSLSKDEAKDEATTLARQIRSEIKSDNEDVKKKKKVRVSNG
jgi:hypothetical protein